MTDARAFDVAGSASQPRRFVVGEGWTIDEAQASGAWLSSDAVVEVRQ